MSEMTARRMDGPTPGSARSYFPAGDTRQARISRRFTSALLVAELGEVLDALPCVPLGVGILQGVDELADEAGRGSDAADHHAGYLGVLDLVVHTGERDRELVVRGGDVGEVGVD